MYHSGIHPEAHRHQFHWHNYLTEHVAVFLITLALLVLIGTLIYMSRAHIPTDIEFRPIYFPAQLVLK